MNSQVPARRPKQRRVAESERRRAVRACDGCRQQKEKCEGGIPCHRCARLYRPCEFHGARDGTKASDRAGLSTSRDEAYIVEVLERSKYMEKLLRHHVRGISLDTDNLRALARNVPESETFLSSNMEEHSNTNMVDQTDSCSDREDLTMDENFTVKPLSHNATHYSGEFSYWNFSMRIKRWIENWGPNANVEANLGATKFEEFYRAEHLESSSHEISASLSVLPPRHITDFLVSMFFRHAETNYFYIDRTWLQVAINTAYDDPSLLTSKDAGTVCSILAILAIGTQYAYLDSKSSTDGAYERAPVLETSTFSEDEVGRKFFGQASKLIPDVITVASLESVQACLLIGLYTLPLDASGLSYIYLSLAVKLGIQNGMHRKYVGDGFDDTTIEFRNRVWWTAITTERRICILHGRPTSIQSSDVDADEPVDHPNMRWSTTSSNIPNMLVSIKMTRILDELAQQVSYLRRCSKSEQVENLRRLAQIKGKLIQLWSSLPDTTSDDDGKPQGPNFRADMHLKLEYCLIRMYAGRPFMFSQDSGTSPSSEIDVLGRPTTRISTRALLIDDCVQAAIEVVEICASLRDHAGLARASYTEFSSCRAALLVIMAQSLQKGTEELKKALQCGLGMIRMMSAGGDSARSEVSLIEAFERAISRMDSFAENVQKDSIATEGSAYDRFKDWEQLWKNDPISTSPHSNQPPTLSTPGPSSGHSNIPLDSHAASFFGLDNFSYSFPHVLEEFSTIPTFDYNFDGALHQNDWTPL